MRTSVKPHACCRYMQGPIDAVLALRAAHRIEPDQVERVEVGMLAAGFPIVCEPAEAKCRPASVVEAQFSLPFGVAVALARGAASPAEFAPACLRDPTVGGLMERVVGVRDPALDAAFPRAWPCWVRIALRGRPPLEAHIEHPRGDPESFLTPAEPRRSIAPLAVLAMLAGPARATTFVGVSERILARAADAIVIGTVEQIETVAGADGTISTLVTLDVEEALKGHVERRLTLKQPGGSIGGRALWIAGGPRFRTGERQLLFLSAAADGTAGTTALGMWQFVLRPHPRTGAVLAERRVDGLVLGDRPLRRVPLARLRRTLARAAAQDGSVAAPLLAAPPELLDPGLERAPVAEFTLMDDPPGRRFEADSGQPVVYQTAGGDAGLGESPSLAAIDGALAAWTNVSGASIVLERGGTTAPAPLSCDRISQIVFGDP